MKALSLLKTVLCSFCLLVSITTQAYSQRTLDIPAVYQRTPLWCWAAVGEMVFSYYGVANINPAGDFQCGIIALLHPVCNRDCYKCPVPAGSRQTMENMLTQYPNFASDFSRIFARISLSSTSRALTMAEITKEIDAGRPVIAGISPSGYERPAGVSEHVSLVIGYDGNRLIVNDPFPFETAMFSGNPYVIAGGQRMSAGRYSISFANFVDRLKWREAIYQFSCEGTGCRRGSGAMAPPPPPPPLVYGRSCRTQFGTCGPFLNQPALPVGSQCYCATAYGPHYGVVVQP